MVPNGRLLLHGMALVVVTVLHTYSVPCGGRGTGQRLGSTFVMVFDPQKWPFVSNQQRSRTLPRRSGTHRDFTYYRRREREIATTTTTAFQARWRWSSSAAHRMSIAFSFAGNREDPKIISRMDILQYGHSTIWIEGMTMSQRHNMSTGWRVDRHSKQRSCDIAHILSLYGTGP